MIMNVHLNIGYGRPFDSEKLQWSYLRLEIADQYGWTLDTIDNLPYVTIQEILAVKTGKAKAKADKRR